MKAFYILWSLLLLMPVLAAMQKDLHQSIVSKRPNIIFMDMNTSDLDPQVGQIEDISLLVVDPNVANIKETMHSAISHQKVLAKHESSIENISAEIMEALETRDTNQDLPILAGSNYRINVCLNFLKKYMPLVCNKLSSQTIDVPTIRTFIKLLHPEDAYEIRTSASSIERVHLFFEELKYYNYCYVHRIQKPLIISNVK